MSSSPSPASRDSRLMWIVVAVIVAATAYIVIRRLSGG